jgi:hypothetical protein
MNPESLPPEAVRISRLGIMAKQPSQREERRGSVQSLWRLILVVIGVVAVVQELRKAPSDRTWQGQVAGFVPYDFRMPTVDRFRDAYWNPDGPIVQGKAWGVGWVLNLGAVKKRVSG